MRLDLSLAGELLGQGGVHLQLDAAVATGSGRDDVALEVVAGTNTGAGGAGGWWEFALGAVGLL